MLDVSPVVSHNFFVLLCDNSPNTLWSFRGSQEFFFVKVIASLLIARAAFALLGMLAD